MNSNYFTQPGIPCESAAAVTSGRFGKLGGTTTRTVAHAGTSDQPHGIIGDDATGSGTSVPLHTSGRGYLTVNGNSANIAPGDKLGPGTADGIGIKVTADGKAYGAIALEQATTDGAIIEVLICHGHISAP